MSSARPYIGRLAPSPTGLLHLGHAATFLVAHRRARAATGQLLMRLDDLDRERSRESFMEAAEEDLLWLGLDWDGSVRQSARLALYREAVTRLLAGGLIYPCTCSRKDLQDAVQAPHEDLDDEPVYHGRCRPANGQARDQTSQALRIQPKTNYRFRVPDGQSVGFVDGNYGVRNFFAGSTTQADLGDFLVWRKDDLPSYQLACVVDDAAMGITEVVRGRDLLKSTARQILLQGALDLPTPAYFHTKLLRDSQGQRLAKRYDALSLRTLREQGFTPAAVRTLAESAASEGM